MNNSFSLFLIIGLLCTQIWTSVHAAEYGSDAHKHDGDVCQIYLQRDHEDYDVLQSFASRSARFDVLTSITPVIEPWIALQAYRVAAPRAPPVAA